MVRAPCCEKMVMKKGSWTTEEDQILVSYIQQHGHSNWQALPKQAGLFRCGKSCRLRWLNYLHPDIKRGNFSEEEYESIVKLHDMLGNRWSAIAARLPGRTDNEVKNVWHTHLKKRLKNHQTLVPKSDLSSFGETRQEDLSSVSLQNSSSEISSLTDLTSLQNNLKNKEEQVDSFREFSQIKDELVENSNARSNVFEDDGMDFWYNLLIRAGGDLPILPEF